MGQGSKEDYHPGVTICNQVLLPVSVTYIFSFLDGDLFYRVQKRH